MQGFGPVDPQLLLFFDAERCHRQHGDLGPRLTSGPGVRRHRRVIKAILQRFVAVWIKMRRSCDYRRATWPHSTQPAQRRSQ